MKSILSISVILLCLAHAIGQDSIFEEEEVTFKNGAVELSGTLMFTDQSKKSPAIVFLHGSGPHERKGFREYAKIFAKLGYSSLFFDKRGTGTSSGSWITASLEDLAKDGAAAVAYLKTRTEIDQTKIGFWGVSQAGWVAPYAASLTKDISFMILISGGGASPYESEMHSYKSWFSAMNFTEEEKQQGIGIIEEYMKYLSSGNGREKLANKLDAVTNKNVQMLSKQLGHILPSEKNRPNWEWVATYDPSEHLKNLEVPVLILAGDLDTNHPTALANEKWETAFADSSELLTTVVFPGAGHGIRVGGHNHGQPGTFADGYWEIQLGWLWKQVVNK